MTQITGGELLARALANEGLYKTTGQVAVPQDMLSRFFEVYFGPAA